MDHPRSHDINALELFSSESGQVFGKLDLKNLMIIKNVTLFCLCYVAVNPFGLARSKLCPELGNC
jgi:hypothetical protein